MEAQSGGCRSAAGGGGGGGGVEVRRIHIIYFLSRKGRIEHPHLIRVHHLSRNGVRLRDVKRWLSELRGKDMPESFAWSYKRRYKTGYVWQDLLEEDLITPISDNEYVLKGSEIPYINLDLRSNGEKKPNSQQKEPKHEQPEEVQERPKTSIDSAAAGKTPCEIEEESPPFGSEASTVTDDSTKLEEEKNSISGATKQDTPKKRDDDSDKTNKQKPQKMKDNNNINSNVEINPRTAAASSASSSSFGKSKSYSSGAANVLRNLITCGAVNTNDSAMVIIKRGDKKSLYLPIDKAEEDDDDDDDDCHKTSTICKGDKTGGSERSFKASWDLQLPAYPNTRKSYEGVKSWDNNKSEFSNQKPVSATYKLVNGPNCSQCGKMFKPEKMHGHMKSCRGMKSFLSRKSSTTAATATTAVAATATATAVATTRRSMDPPCRESLSVSDYFLTN